MIQESVSVIITGHDPENAYSTFIFDLALQVKIENRQVNSISGMFGNVVGVKDFLVFIFSLLIGSFPSRRYLHD